MCCSKNRLRVKLGDFGLASILPPGEIAVARPQLFGSALYTPPEETSSFAADMWASGITCYVIMSGNFPFGTPAEARTLAPSFCASCWQRASPLVPDFIRDLLHRKPEHRPSVAEALLHPWLSSPGGARVHHGLVTEPTAHAEASMSRKQAREPAGAASEGGAQKRQRNHRLLCNMDVACSLATAGVR